MNKVKFLSAIVILLVIANVLMCIMIYRNEKPPQRGDGPRNEIIEKLHFNDMQIKDYDKLIMKHRADINKAQDGIRSLKNILYQQLQQQAVVQNSDSLISQINSLQKEIEYIHWHHFKDIQKLCTTDQQAYFDALTTEIARLFSPHPPHKK